MRMRSAVALLVLSSVVGAAPWRDTLGDSTYGTITAVRRSNLVVFNYGKGEYNVALVGIAVSGNNAVEARARQFLNSMVLGKRVQFRFEYRARNGEMIGRLLTTDSASAASGRPFVPRDVGVELVAAGLARRQADYDYKYQELSKAESSARTARRGLWATNR